MPTTWQPAVSVVEMASGVRRFLPPGLAADPLPFPAYVTQPPGPEPTDAPREPDPRPAVVPEFDVSGVRPVLRVGATAGTEIMGLGEVCGRLVHRDRTIVGSTVDAFGYDEGSESLYQAHPWFVAVRGDGSAFGVLVETTWRFEAAIGDVVTCTVDGPSPPVVVIEGDGVLDVVERLTTLVGRAPLPPRWALGFQQSRWSYHPDTRVRSIAAELRSRRLPCDVLWIDIDYMDGFRVFTFDPEHFPDPAALNADMNAQGFRMAWMIDPGVKVDPGSGYRVYDEAIEGDHVLRRPDGEVAVGTVWPGDVVFPDYTRSSARGWWAGLYRDFMAAGVDAVWNDMNEPTTIEDRGGSALAGEVVHQADEDLGGPGDHFRYRNVYGMLMTRASRDGMIAAAPDRRPFLLTRSTFLGGHRYAATWTGDNASNWDHLAWSIPMVLNLGLSAQPLAGPDIGGFAGDCSGPLLARWMGIGCLLPFARNHSMLGSADQEPWAFGPEVEATCRRALERRMRLLPYLYTCMADSAATGRPVARPAFVADPTDRALRGVDTAFVLGDDLYVRCDVTPECAGPVAPVPDGWVRIEVIDGGDADRELPELYLRPGAALPLGPVMQFSDERSLEVVELVVGPDRRGHGVGWLYEDDGEGLAHESGAYRRTRLDAADGSVDCTVTAGHWPPGPWEVRVRGPKAGADSGGR